MTNAMARYRLDLEVKSSAAPSYPCLTPDGDGSGQDWVQVVALDKQMLTGTLVGKILDPDMDGVASGAMFGNSLYVNNARYYNLPEPDTEYWITKLSIRDVQP